MYFVDLLPPAQCSVQILGPQMRRSADVRVYFPGDSSDWDVKIPTVLYGETKLRGLSPRANYTDRAAAAGRRS